MVVATALIPLDRSTVGDLHSMKWLFAACLVLSVSPPLAAQPPQLTADTWAATDSLGRTLPGLDECGPQRRGRQVGIFYFVWHGAHGQSGPHDITKLTEADDKPDWAAPGVFHHWGQPEWGYYLADDHYVLRQHASLLADAGVDVAIIDVTNGFVYQQQVAALFAAWDEHRRLGNPTPKIAFLANSQANQVTRQLYEQWYRSGRYRELWFMWQGKPLLLARRGEVDEDIRDFFTLRQSWAWSSAPWFGDGRDRWPWLDHTPQQPGWHVEGQPEAISVAVAQHPTSNIGRSHHRGVQPQPEAQQPEQGIYFAEQWQRAREVDPPFVFVTGWNEWVAQRFIKQPNTPPTHMIGKPLQAGDTYFVDLFNQEYSRDIEPMRGGHGDAYYWQLVAEVRRYKGVTDQPPRGVYYDTRGDIVHRDHPRWGAASNYVERSGRNDIVSATFESNAATCRFAVECAEPLTPATDSHWMQLLIDIDRDPATGWRGYDLVVNRIRRNDETSDIEPLTTAGTPGPAMATARLRIEGARLVVEIPRHLLGDGLHDLEFHWCDNQAVGDRDFGSRGDHAPNRRFNYVVSKGF
jgi:hypothetical protein